jgi:hypothetical protein
VHTRELPFWVPKFQAAKVNRRNFRDLTLRVDNTAVNTLMWALREERGLTYWVNPDGLEQGQTALYWYPRDEALKLQHELETEDQTLKNYRFMLDQVEMFKALTGREFEQTQIAAFSPKRF